MTTDHWPTLHQDPYALARLKKSIKLCNILPHHSVLDIGCHQEEVRQFIPKSCDYVGLDHIKGDDFDGGFSLHRKFDRILCLEVLEHLQWPRKTLSSITEHLSDDGIAVISLPNEATLFHRIRSFFGTVDAECFSETGKHLHLPSLRQCKNLISEHFEITKLALYISRGQGSRSKIAICITKLLPEKCIKLLSVCFPSLFARGFIFVCKKLN